ncbi:MAG: molybdopterin-guanine dinucleotide biosynthesis protein B [Candidatus Thorarchaeota archaeon]
MWFFIKIIDVIGYSGSGKTYFISTAIKYLKKELNLNISVIKNVKHHRIDDQGKDSYNFTKAGASYSIIKNEDNEAAIFVNINNLNFNRIIEWLQKGPYELDLVFTEGFRNFKHPTILCVNKLEEIKPQLNKYVKMVSGMICQNQIDSDNFTELPIVNIETSFRQFLEIFKIK